MRFKHVLYIATLACALAEIGMALYAMHWGGIIKEIAYAEQVEPDGELAIVRALNILMPVGILCIGILFYTRKVDNIGGFAMCLALGLHLVGLDLNVRAVKKVYGDGTALSSVTWWYPDSRPETGQEEQTAATEPNS